MSRLSRVRQAYASRCQRCGHVQGSMSSTCGGGCHTRPTREDADLVIAEMVRQRRAVAQRNVVQRPAEQKNPVAELGELLGVNRRHKKRHVS